MTPPVRDPSLAWRIALRARLHAPLDADRLGAAWERLRHEQGWAASGLTPAGWDDAVTGTDPVTIGRDADGVRVTVAADHDHADGLGLLRILDALVEGGVGSDARGVADRPAARGARRARLREVLLDPPARLTPPGGPTADRSHQPIVEADVAGSRRAADLVHAVARVGARHARGRQVAVAVGAGRPSTDRVIRDDSALLRLTGVERLDRDAVAAALRTAPLQPPASDGTGGTRLAATAALRLLGPRLGSTFLVSHLGRVTAPAVADLRFAPVTGSGGLALGALTLDDVTRLTLRAAGNGWDAARLDGVLAEIVVELS